LYADLECPNTKCGMMFKADQQQQFLDHILYMCKNARGVRKQVKAFQLFLCIQENPKDSCFFFPLVLKALWLDWING
jgi:hypothetical protein